MKEDDYGVLCICVDIETVTNNSEEEIHAEVSFESSDPCLYSRSILIGSHA